MPERPIAPSSRAVGLPQPIGWYWVLCLSLSLRRSLVSQFLFRFAYKVTHYFRVTNDLAPFFFHTKRFPPLFWFLFQSLKCVSQSLGCTSQTLKCTSKTLGWKIVGTVIPYFVLIRKKKTVTYRNSSRRRWIRPASRRNVSTRKQWSQGRSPWAEQRQQGYLTILPKDCGYECWSR